MENKPLLIVMCGLQCSGKSTKAKELKQKYDAVILSSDAIRQEHPDWDNASVFKVLHFDMNDFLNDGRNVIVDATNITNKARRQLMSNLKEPCYKVCYIMNTPYNICLERLQKRNEMSDTSIQQDFRFVPKEALEKYYKSFEIPFYEEGWDDIVLDKEIDVQTSADNKYLLLHLSDGFDQRNKHHTQDLGKHMQYVGDILEKLTDDNILIQAGYFHDVGKLYTQTVGEDGNCHYYNHDSVGAYNLMCMCSYYDNDYSKDNNLRWLFYINYHMKLHSVTTEKSIKKWKRIFGENLYNTLKLFESVDKSRPDTVL